MVRFSLSLPNKLFQKNFNAWEPIEEGNLENVSLIAKGVSLMICDEFFGCFLFLIVMLAFDNIRLLLPLQTKSKNIKKKYKKSRQTKCL